MAHRAAIVVLITVLVSVSVAFGGGSVFSGNGVGEEQISGGTRALALGGGAFGLRDSMSFNSTNPALVAFANRTTMRLGAQVAFWNTTSDGLTDSDMEMSWKEVGLIFPLTQKWKLGFGVQPTRRQDLHTIALRSAEFPGDTVAQTYEERLTWSGSTVDIRLDNAYRFSERFALGVGAIYSILHSERSATLDFDNSDFRDVRYTERSTFRGWTISLGGYWEPISRLSLGGYYRPRIPGTWTSEISKSGSDSTLKSDGRNDAPGEIALGVAYRLSTSFVGVADVRMGQWSSGDYGVALGAENAHAPEDPFFVSLGIERLARRSPTYAGFDLWSYRAGAFYRKHYWPIVNDQSVDDIGVALGLSIPVAQSSGWIHGAAELGQRGLDEQKLGAQELFARFTFQIEIGESWFQRAKPRIPE